MFRQDLFNAENLQRLGNIEHFGNRRGFLQTPAPKRSRQPRNLPVNIHPAAFCLEPQNLPLPINRGMVKSDVETTSSQGISNPAFLVGSEHGKRNRSGLDRPKLWDGQWPITKQLQ